MRQCGRLLQSAKVPRAAAVLAPAVASLAPRGSPFFAAAVVTPAQRRLLHSSLRVASAAGAKPEAESAAGETKTETASDSSGASGSSSEAAAGGAGSAAPHKKPGKLSSFMDGAKDVFAVVFGTERKRDLGAEYDAGLRKYPWYSYADPTDPESGRVLYRNEETGVVTEHKPADFDARAPPDARMVPLNTEATAVSVVAPTLSAYQRMIAALGDAPLIRVLAQAGQAVAESPVGEAAAKVRDKVKDKVEDAREVWETSQHPLVVNVSYTVDSLMAESESGRALREIQQLDSGFDPHAFLEEMQDKFIPELAGAFFSMDESRLSVMCRDAAMAQIRAVAAAREVEGLTMGVGAASPVLAVQKTDFVQARKLEAGVPIILVTSLVQYIHCVRNRKGEIVEGSESDIRATHFILAVTRDVDPATGALAWRVVEMSLQGTMAYL